MATTIPPSSNGEVISEKELYFPFDEAIKTLPVFLQPDDELERKELAMFLSQVDDLHKPVVGKLSATSVLNYLNNMLKPATSTADGPSQDTFTEQFQEFTGNIAFEIARSVAGGDDLHITTISVLKVLQEVSWETKATLTITSFVLTFGDTGLNLCEESKVSANEIQMFAELKGAHYKHQLESSDNFFVVVFQLIRSIVEFENLPITYMTSMDLKVKSARTHLIVIVYWIIRFIVAAATSHIKKLSSRGNEFDKIILALWEFRSQQSKKLNDLNDDEYLNNMLSNLQDLLEKDVDIEAYNKIKKIVERGNYSDNMEVLNSLFPSQDAHPLNDCLRKRKVHLDELKGAHVLLLISGLENIAPEVDETKLNEFIDSFDPKRSNDEVESCNMVWMPIIDRDRSVQHKNATTKSMVKSLLDKFYIVHHHLNTIVEFISRRTPRNFKGWYFVDDPSKISNEVKKLIRDDWKYKKYEPMIVVLDPQGNVVNYNAFHMFYAWSVSAFPFTSKMEKYFWDTNVALGHAFATIYWALPQFYLGSRNWRSYVFYYGGENMEWIRSFTKLTREIEGEIRRKIIMVYVGNSHLNHNQEQARRVNEENISDFCLSDHYYLWLFWTRIKSFIYSGVHAHRFLNKKDELLIRSLQKLLNYDQSNVGWVVPFINVPIPNYLEAPIWHGKAALSTLKEFRLWKEKASHEGFFSAFTEHYDEVYRNIFPFLHCQFPTSALQAPIDTMLCPDCNSPMQQYANFVCYHS